MALFRIREVLLAYLIDFLVLDLDVNLQNVSLKENVRNMEESDLIILEIAYFVAETRRSREINVFLIANPTNFSKMDNVCANLDSLNS